MALDNIYWNPSEYEYEEPLSTFSKSYVDPWDLENYAYLQQYLCSDSNSEESSFGGSMNEKGPPPTPVRSQVRKTMSQPIVFDKTDGIFDYESNRIPGKRISKENEEVYGVLDFDTDSEVEETSFGETMISTKDNSFVMFLSKTRDTTNQNPIYQLRGRSSSYSYGDHKHDPNSCLNDVYCRLNDLVANSKRTIPIYDDVRHSKPHFTLGKSGHLQIDYSWSWNNLDKYIYN